MPAETNWICSVEARRKLGGTSCDLMHLRNAGKLRFEKKGNAYRYAAEDVNHQAAKRKRTSNNA